jgi:hypothetical protein
MKCVYRTQLLVAVSCILFVFSCSACTLTGGGIHIGSNGPAVKGGGPPPHAPAHGYRAKHAYYYYPDVYVYFDISRKVYFYIQRDQWRMSASLPHSFRVRLGDHVQIELDSERPYTYFDTHKKKYPPGQMKKKGKYVKKKKR